jgi:hypothetical protein
MSAYVKKQPELLSKTIGFRRSVPSAACARDHSTT